MLICPMRDPRGSEGECYACIHGAPHEIQKDTDCRIEKCHMKGCVCVMHSTEQWDN
jgi:hypothetical protein